MITISYSIYAMMRREATGNTSNGSVMILGELPLKHSTSKNATTTSRLPLDDATQLHHNTVFQAIELITPFCIDEINFLYSHSSANKANYSIT
jgi:hypothetical protein